MLIFPSHSSAGRAKYLFNNNFRPSQFGCFMVVLHIKKTDELQVKLQYLFPVSIFEI